MSNSITKLISDLENKKGVSEIIINGPESIFVERNSELVRVTLEVEAKDFSPFCEMIAKMNNTEFNEGNPIIDGNLPDGSRINIISEAYTGSYPAITIRKYSKTLNRFSDLNGKFGISSRWIEFFKSLVKARKNVIIAGGTSSGKTTFLNLMLQEISPRERVVTIEDTKELSFDIPNKVGLVCKTSRNVKSHNLQMNDLLKNSLRMFPTRIIVGEVRGAEVFDLLQAMNTGHDGCMSTVHASSSVEVLSRLENLFAFSGIEVPQKAVRGQMSTGIDYIIFLSRGRDSERIVSEVYEITGMEGEVIVTQPIGAMTDGRLDFTGVVPKSINDLIEAGLDPDFFTNL